MRDIWDYEIKYKEEPCETYQVKYRRRKVLELIMKYPHENVLEIGCGLEPLFCHLQEYKKMVIVEPGQSFIDNAICLSKTAKKEIVCIKGFLEECVDQIKKLDIGFDYIVLSSLLHEVEEPGKLLKAIRDICEENTIVHINVPNANSIHRLLAKEMGLIDDVHELSPLQIKMQRNHVYDTESLCGFLTKCGFEVLEQGTFFPKFLSATQMEQMLKEKIIEENVFEGLYRLIKYIPEFGSELYVQVRKKE